MRCPLLVSGKTLRFSLMGDNMESKYHIQSKEQASADTKYKEQMGANEGSVDVWATIGPVVSPAKWREKGEVGTILSSLPPIAPCEHFPILPPLCPHAIQCALPWYSKSHSICFPVGGCLLKITRYIIAGGCLSLGTGFEVSKYSCHFQ